MSSIRAISSRASSRGLNAEVTGKFRFILNCELSLYQQNPILICLAIHCQNPRSVFASNSIERWKGRRSRETDRSRTITHSLSTFVSSFHRVLCSFSQEKFPSIQEVALGHKSVMKRWALLLLDYQNGCHGEFDNPFRFRVDGVLQTTSLLIEEHSKMLAVWDSPPVFTCSPTRRLSPNPPRASYSWTPSTIP